MICQFCQQVCDDNEKFCSKCGAQMPAAAPPAPSPDAAAGVRVEEVVDSVQKAVKSIPKTRIIGIASVAVVVLLAVILVTSIFGSGSGTKINKDAFVVYLTGETASDDYKLVTHSGKTVTVDVDSYLLSRSNDRRTMLVLNDDSDLFVYTAGGSKRVASDVYTAVMSRDGKYIAYMSDTDGNEAALHWYDVSKGSATKISGSAYTYGSPVLSPDGKTVGFVGQYDDGEYTGYISVGGKDPVSIGKMAEPLAVGNGGKHAHYIKRGDSSSDMALYYYTKSESTKLASGSFTGSFFLNKDYTQIMYGLEGRTYVSIKDGDRVKVFNASGVSPMIAPGTERVYSYTGAGMTCNTYNRSTLAGQYVRLDGGLYYLTKKWSGEKIASSYNSAQVSADGKSLLYIGSSGDLMYVKNADKKIDADTVGDDFEAISLYASSDLSKIYFVNEDDELQYCKRNGKAKKIADDVSSGYMTLDRSSNTLYFLYDYRNGVGELMSSKNGGERTKSKATGASEAAGVWVVGGTLFYAVDSDGDYTVYRMNGSKAEKLGDSRNSPSILY